MSQNVFLPVSFKHRNMRTVLQYVLGSFEYQHEEVNKGIYFIPLQSNLFQIISFKLVIPELSATNFINEVVLTAKEIKTFDEIKIDESVILYYYEIYGNTIYDVSLSGTYVLNELERSSEFARLLKNDKRDGCFMYVNCGEKRYSKLLLEIIFEELDI